MIPEEEIKFDDKRPYHTIDMYKKLVQYHIGLQVRSMVNNNYQSVEVGEPIRGSYPKPDTIEPSYKRCDGDEKIKFPIEADVEFTYLGMFACFFMLCKTPVQVYRYQNTLFFVMEAGERAKGIYTPSDVYEQDTWQIHKTLRYDILYQLLLATEKQFETIDQIVFSGHSNGMAASTLLSYLFCAAKDEAFLEKIREKLDEPALEFIEKCKIGIPRLGEISLFVVGTGGFPILFESKEEFK